MRTYRHKDPSENSTQYALKELMTMEEKRLQREEQEFSAEKSRLSEQISRAKAEKSSTTRQLSSAREQLSMLKARYKNATMEKAPESGRKSKRKPSSRATAPTRSGISAVSLSGLDL